MGMDFPLTTETPQPLNLSRRGVLGGALGVLALGIGLRPGMALSQPAAQPASLNPFSALLEIRLDSTAVLRCPSWKAGKVSPPPWRRSWEKNWISTPRA
jgi:hypothetical protein